MNKEYPCIVPAGDGRGLIAWLSPKVSLPGVYTDYLRAERAISRELAIARERKANRKSKAK